MKKSRRKKRGLRIFLSVFSVLLVVVVGFGIYLSLYKPSPDDALPFSDPDGEYSPEADQYNFLFVGRDHSDALADVIMIVHFNTREGALSLMQIPRDTYLEAGARSVKINAAYAAFYRQTRAEGAKSPETEAAPETEPAAETTVPDKPVPSPTESTPIESTPTESIPVESAEPPVTEPVQPNEPNVPAETAESTVPEVTTEPGQPGADTTPAPEAPPAEPEAPAEPTVTGTPEETVPTDGQNAP